MQSCQLAAGPEQKELGRKWGNFSRYWGTVWDGAEGLLFFAEFFAFKKNSALNSSKHFLFILWEKA